AAAAPGSGTPTGTVTFKDGATTLGTGTLSSGAATFATSSLSLAAHSITAVYGGDTNFTVSTSSTLTQNVNQAGSATTVSSSANPSVFLQSVTFTATVTASAPGSGTPTGTVTFKDGTATLGTGTLSAGKATLTLANLSLGLHNVTATYGGSTNFLGGSFAAGAATVSPDTTAVALAPSVNPAPARPA